MKKIISTFFLVCFSLSLQAQTIFGQAIDSFAQEFINTNSMWFKNATNTIDNEEYSRCLATHTFLTAAIIRGDMGNLSDDIKIIHTIEGKVLAQTRINLINKGHQQAVLDSKVRAVRNNFTGPNGDKILANSISFCRKRISLGLN
jgi:hypothetical protein